jgi:hypothetical protein
MTTTTPAQELLDREQSGDTIGYAVDWAVHCIPCAAKRYGLVTLSHLPADRLTVFTVEDLPGERGGTITCALCRQSCRPRHGSANATGSAVAWYVDVESYDVAVRPAYSRSAPSSRGVFIRNEWGDERFIKPERLFDTEDAALRYAIRHLNTLRELLDSSMSELIERLCGEDEERHHERDQDHGRHGHHRGAGALHRPLAGDSAPHVPRHRQSHGAAHEPPRRDGVGAAATGAPHGPWTL